MLDLDCHRELRRHRGLKVLPKRAWMRQIDRRAVGCKPGVIRGWKARHAEDLHGGIRPNTGRIDRRGNCQRWL
jgi:hypothetical protein